MPPPVHTVRVLTLRDVTHGFSDPVPTGFAWILRTINVAYGGLLLTEVTVKAGGLLLIDRTLFTQPGGPSDTMWDGYHAMREGERIEVRSSGQGQGVDAVATAYLLTLP